MKLDVSMRVYVIHDKRRDIHPSIELEVPDATVLSDDGTIGCAWNHMRAMTGDCLVIEDDAILCRNFIAKAVSFMQRHPSACTSFYMGRSAPSYIQSTYSRAIQLADRLERDAIVLPALYHGVCYHLSHDLALRVLDGANNYGITRGMVDEHISRYITSCVYSWPCLADHAGGEAMVEHRGIRPYEPRVAWKFIDDIRSVDDA